MRLMYKEDVAQVTEIDREVFPTLWPPVNFQHELQNQLAHYVVAYKEGEIAEEPKVETATEKGWLHLISRVRQLFHHNRIPSNESPTWSKQYIVGFAGFWMMAEEAHVSNLAVREPYRHQGIGELLLISIIDMATEMKAGIITLEVRASNTAAQRLYSKYGFTEVGIRRGYYSDNKEDAILMSTESTTLASFQMRFQQLKQSHFRKWGIALHQTAR